MAIRSGGEFWLSAGSHWGYHWTRRPLCSHQHCRAARKVISGCAGGSLASNCCKAEATVTDPQQSCFGGRSRMCEAAEEPRGGHHQADEDLGWTHGSRDGVRTQFCRGGWSDLPLRVNHRRLSGSLCPSARRSCERTLRFCFSRVRGSCSKADEESCQEQCGEPSENVEEMLSVIAQNFAKVTGEPGSSAGGSKSAKPKTNPKPSVQPVPKIRGLDNASVRAALEAGIPMDHLQEMGKILKAKPTKLEDVPRKKVSLVSGSALDESEEDAEEVEVIREGDGTAADGGPKGVEEAILQLTRIAAKLTGGSAGKKEKMEQLLDGVSGSAGSTESSGHPGTRKNAAALRALQRCLREDPKFIFQTLENNLQTDFQGRAVQAGEPMSGNATVRGWLTGRSRIQNYQQHVRWCWSLGGIWDCLIAGQNDEARARCGLRSASSSRPGFNRPRILDPIDGRPFRTCAAVPALQQPQSTDCSRSSALSALRCEVGGTFLVSPEGGRCVLRSKEETWRARDPTEGQRGRGQCSGKGSSSESKSKRRERKGKEDPRSGGRSLRSGDVSGGPEAGVPSENNTSQPKGIRVPGSTASTFTGVGAIELLMRVLFKSRCRLSTFARSFAAQRFYWTDVASTVTHELFPMPLPYPEVFAKKEEEGPVVNQSLKKMVVMMIIVLNFLHLGRAKTIAQTLKSKQRLTRQQWQSVKRLEAYVEAWTEVSPIGPEQMGRTAGKVESLEEVLRGLESRALDLIRKNDSYFPDKKQEDLAGDPGLRSSVPVGIPLQGSMSTFKTIESSRLKFVGTPSFDPTPYLDPVSKQIYLDPLGTRDEIQENTPKPPTMRIHCSKKEKLKLLELLDSSDRLSLHLPEEVVPVYGNGLFCVAKDLQRDRLILDARGANVLERPPNRWIKALAGGDLLTRAVLEDHELLVSSGNDLRDFYYFFKASDSRSRRNVLVSPFHPKQLCHLGAFRQRLLKSKVIYGALATLAMGDTQAVELAESCHLGLSLQRGIVNRNNLLSLTRPYPRGDMHWAGDRWFRCHLHVPKTAEGASKEERRKPRRCKRATRWSASCRMKAKVSEMRRRSLFGE